MDKIVIIIEVLQLVLAIMGLAIAYFEYCKHTNQNKYAVMSEYNKRYNDDKNIEAVVKYLIWFLEGNSSGKEQVPDIPTVYQKEMFMRFYEELQLQVENNRIGKGKIEDFFAYYAVAACMCPNFVEGTELLGGDERVWARFKAFVKSYPNLYKMIAKEYKCHHSENDSIVLLLK